MNIIKLTKSKTITILSCNRCKEKWVQRLSHEPGCCPFCHSPRYNVARTRNIKQEFQAKTIDEC